MPYILPYIQRPVLIPDLLRSPRAVSWRDDAPRPPDPERDLSTLRRARSGADAGRDRRRDGGGDRDCPWLVAAPPGRPRARPGRRLAHPDGEPVLRRRDAAPGRGRRPKLVCKLRLGRVRGRRRLSHGLVEPDHLTRC